MPKLIAAGNIPGRVMGMLWALVACARRLINICVQTPSPYFAAQKKYTKNGPYSTLTEICKKTEVTALNHINHVIDILAHKATSLTPRTHKHFGYAARFN